MERVVRLYQLWSWLPHFRVVAETEHLPTASEALGLSPSALSRALKQLEEEIGFSLFLRNGRTIQLNSEGKELLSAVRNGMRRIDDVLSSLSDEKASISLNIAAPSPFHTYLLIDLAKELKSDYPRLDIGLASCPMDSIVPHLCRGVIDVVIHEGAVAHPELQSMELCSMPKVVACASSHPLAGIEQVRKEQLASYPFAAPPPNEQGVRLDGWPEPEKRNIELTLDSMQTGIGACLSGHYLVVLPRILVELSGLQEIQIQDWQEAAPALYVTRRIPGELQAKELHEFLHRLSQLLA